MTADRRWPRVLPPPVAARRPRQFRSGGSAAATARTAGKSQGVWRQNLHRFLSGAQFRRHRKRSGSRAQLTHSGAAATPAPPPAEWRLGSHPRRASRGRRPARRAADCGRNRAGGTSPPRAPSALSARPRRGTARTAPPPAPRAPSPPAAPPPWPPPARASSSGAPAATERARWGERAAVSSLAVPHPQPPLSPTNHTFTTTHPPQNSKNTTRKAPFCNAPSSASQSPSRACPGTPGSCT